MEHDIIEFLQQSNYIEGVSDSQSLDDAIIAWKFLSKQKEMNIKIILETHRLLMINKHIQDDEKGYFRKCEVRVGHHYGLNHILIQEAMEPWAMNAWLYPDHWKQHHIKFEKIHPFVDGNGRTGRMLMNWERLKANLRILVIREEERFDYYQWFRSGLSRDLIL